jgi:hypothetical protein
MEMRTEARPGIGSGRKATTAALAGLAGLAVAAVAAASMLAGDALGAERSSTVPGRLDELAAAAAQSSDRGNASKLDDYGTRCRVVGWCDMPPGVPQP